MHRIFARLTADGTVCGETALCEACIEGRRQAFANPFHIKGRDAPTGIHEACADNDFLICQVCGYSLKRS